MLTFHRSISLLLRSTPKGVYMARIKRVLVVGGGVAGWLTACYLAKTLGGTVNDGVHVELVESPRIPLIGVGEGTFPSIRGTLAAIGLDERRFLAAAGATYKQGIRYVDWVRPAGAPGPHHYFHPFSLPSQRDGSPELLPYWLLGGAPDGTAFADAVTMQSTLVEHGRAPKRLGDADFRGPLNHAFHFDAVGFAAVLAEHGQSLDVRRHLATVERVELDAGGAIASVVTGELGALSADLFVDCTGQAARLIGEAMQSPFRDRGDVLFADRAVTVQVPHDSPDTALPPYTIATAQEAGWIWDIALQTRRGVGYVYSSRHTDDEQAERTIRSYLGPAADALGARRLRFETGYRPEPWRKNCVAIGLAAGFLEPLESTGIALIELGAYMLAHLFPADTDELAYAARHFNRMMEARFERIIDFLKLHYCLSQRTDSTFWIDNTHADSIPQSLKERLALWRSRPPHRLDFVTDLEMFMPASWQYVLYGMEFKTDLEPMRGAYPQMAQAQREFAMIRQAASHALSDLPDHRALLRAMCQPSQGIA